MSTHPLTHTALCCVALALGGCAAPGGEHAGHGGRDAHGMGGAQGMAVATLTPTQGHTVRGIVMFHEMDGHLMVHAQLTGLKPGGEHGFHVHETGNCASADGTSAGGHFNPTGQPHGPATARTTRATCRC